MADPIHNELWTFSKGKHTAWALSFKNTFPSKPEVSESDYKYYWIKSLKGCHIKHV